MEFARPWKATYGRTRKWGRTWDSLLAAPLQGGAAHSRNCGETLRRFCHAHGWQHLTGLCAYRWGRSLSHTKASRFDVVVLVVCFLEEATSNPLFIHWGPKDPKTAALWRNKNWCCKTYSWPLITCLVIRLPQSSAWTQAARSNNLTPHHRPKRWVSVTSWLWWWWWSGLGGLGFSLGGNRLCELLLNSTERPKTIGPH